MARQITYPLWTDTSGSSTQDSLPTSWTPSSFPPAPPLPPRPPPPPRPPKRPINSWRQDPRWQFVWPNDKRRGIWGRWKDILTNKGPDIFIAEQNTREPERPIWSNWKTPGPQHPDDHRPRWGNGKSFRQDQELPGVFACQRRDLDTKFDFKTRRFRKPSAEVWSDVERTESGRVIRARDPYGRLFSLGR